MDGRALAELFGDLTDVPRHGSSYRDAQNAASSRGSVYNTTEEAELRERLRALGYIE